jgi:hypothetical protein
MLQDSPVESIPRLDKITTSVYKVETDSAVWARSPLAT